VFSQHISLTLLQNNHILWLTLIQDFESTGVNLSIIVDHKKSPRLHLIDTGLVNYFASLQKELVSIISENSKRC